MTTQTQGIRTQPSSAPWDGFDPYPPPPRPSPYADEVQPRFSQTHTKRPAARMTQPIITTSNNNNLTSSSTARPSTALSTTFREHMATARAKWAVTLQLQQQQQTQQLPVAASEPGLTRTIPITATPASSLRPPPTGAFSARSYHLQTAHQRAASASLTRPSPPMPQVALTARPSSSSTIYSPRSTSTRSPIGAASQQPRLETPTSPSAYSASLIPQSHYRASRLLTPTTLDFDSSSVAPPRATNLTHVPLTRTKYPGEYFKPAKLQPKRFYRGWAQAMPKRDDDEEERVYQRNKMNGIKPPLQTLTAAVIKLMPKTSNGTTIAPKIRLKKKMQPFFTLPEPDDDLRPTTNGELSNPPSSSVFQDHSGALIQPRHKLLVDKNDFSQIRLSRYGLEYSLHENALPPAGLENSHVSDWWQGSDKEFSSLFPSSDLLGYEQYLTTNGQMFQQPPLSLTIENLLKARDGSRPQEIDPRAKLNTDIRKLYRPGKEKSPKGNKSNQYHATHPTISRSQLIANGHHSRASTEFSLDES